MIISSIPSFGLIIFMKLGSDMLVIALFLVSDYDARGKKRQNHGICSKTLG